jgi:hypothetical protein
VVNLIFTSAILSPKEASSTAPRSPLFESHITHFRLAWFEGIILPMRELHIADPEQTERHELEDHCSSHYLILHQAVMIQQQN